MEHMGKKIKVVDIVVEEPTSVTDEVMADVEPEQAVVNDTPPTDVVNDETLTPIEPTQKPKAKTTGRSKKKQTVKAIVSQTLEVEPVKEVEEEVPTPSIEAKEKVKKSYRTS